MLRAKWLNSLRSINRSKWCVCLGFTDEWAAKHYAPRTRNKVMVPPENTALSRWPVHGNEKMADARSSRSQKGQNARSRPGALRAQQMNAYDTQRTVQCGGQFVEKPIGGAHAFVG